MQERDAFAADELVVILEMCPALATLVLDAEEPANNLLEMANALRRDRHRLMALSLASPPQHSVA